MRLTCLGTGDAFGSVGRHNAGYLLETQAGALLVDAGPSVLVALKRLQREPSSIDAVVVSHLHGDHFGGVPFLLLDYTYESRRERPLLVIGPPGTERRVLTLYYTLYSERRDQPVPFPLRFVEVGDGSAFEVGDARIESFYVPHQETELSLGHRIRSAGRSVVYSGDTPWTDDLLRHSSGADLFLCECSTFEEPIPRHIRYVEIEKHRQRFECRDLLLIHIGREVRRRAPELAVALADDGLERSIG
jgi:ribonuclease BN (tRNA processing enzyme)